MGKRWIGGKQLPKMTSIEDAASETIAYYERNAERYALQTGSADLTSLRSSFCEQLALGARILDVGCGSGRDFPHFERLVT